MSAVTLPVISSSWISSLPCYCQGMWADSPLAVPCLLTHAWAGSSWDSHSDPPLQLMINSIFFFFFLVMLDNLFLITYCSSHPLAIFHQWNFNLPQFCGWAMQCLGHTTPHFCPRNEVTANVKQEKWECSFDTTLPSASVDLKFSEGQIQSILSFWNFAWPFLVLHKSQQQ